MMKHALVLMLLAALTCTGAEIIISGTNRSVASPAGFYPPVASETSATLPYPVKRLLAADAQLDDLELLSAVLTFGQPSKPEDYFAGTICHIVRTAGECTFQVQALAHNYIKAVKIRLFQDGDSVMAQTLWARFQLQSAGLGTDLDVAYAGTMSVQTCNMAPASNHYGLESLVVRRRASDADFTAFGERAVTAADVVCLKDDAALKVDEATPAVDPFAGAAVVLDPGSMLRVTNRLSTTLSSVFAGTNCTFELRGATGDAITGEATSGGRAMVLSTSAGVLVAEGVGLADVIDFVSADYRWSSTSKNPTPVSSAEPASKTEKGASWLTCVERLADSIRFQVQWVNSNDNNIFCSVDELYEESGNLMVRRVCGRYSNRNIHPLGTDFLTASGVIEHDSNDYISNLVVRVRYSPLLNTSADLRAARTATMDVRGKQLVTVTGDYAFPASGILRIASGATVTMNPALSMKPEALVIEIEAGGTLRQGVGAGKGAGIDRLFADDNAVQVKGGTLAFATANSNDGGSRDAGTYVNTLNISDGGSVTGFRPRVRNATWTVSGSEPCTATGVYLVENDKTYDGDKSFRVNVADCTGDDAADFITTDGLTEYWRWNNTANSFYGLRVVKAGAGTWRMDAANDHHGLMEIAGGTLLLNTSASLPDSAGVVLKGGTLAVAAGTTNAVKTLEIGSAGGGPAYRNDLLPHGCAAAMLQAQRMRREAGCEGVSPHGHRNDHLHPLTEGRSTCTFRPDFAIMAAYENAP